MIYLAIYFKFEYIKRDSFEIKVIYFKEKKMRRESKFTRPILN